MQYFGGEMHKIRSETKAITLPPGGSKKSFSDQSFLLASIESFRTRSQDARVLAGLPEQSDAPVRLHVDCFGTRRPNGTDIFVY